MLRPAGSDPGGVNRAGGRDHPAIRRRPRGNRRGDRAGDRPAQDLLPSGPCQRDNGPRLGLRRFRRVRPSDRCHLPRSVGLGREDRRNRTGPAGSLCRRLRGWLGSTTRNQVQPDGEGIPRHCRHRPHGLHLRLRQASGFGRVANHHGIGYGRFHGRRPDSQLRHHDQAPPRRLGVP